MNKAERYYAEAVGSVSVLALVLYACRVIAADTTRYSFMVGNLVLAWAGLLFGWWLVKNLRKTRWTSWQNLLLSLAWLVCLPNTWYVLTDYLHVYATGEISELYDIVMIGMMVLAGFALGLTSLYLIHREVARRLSTRDTWLIVEAVVLLSSFAIYLGRVERLSSWDVLTNTGGLVVTASDRVIDPLANLHAWNVTGLFFVTISVCYFAFWRVMQIFETSKSSR